MPTRRFENLEPDRKRAILDAAQTEFTNHGFQGASLNSIISDAGISKGSFYYYFEDKADLYVTALERVARDVMARIGGIFAGEYTDDFWADIAQLLAKSKAVLSEDPGLVKFLRGMYHLSANFTKLPLLQQYMDHMRAVYTEIIRHGQEMGAVRDDVPIDLLVHVMFAMDEGLDRWMFDHFESFSDDDMNWLVDCSIDLMKRVAAKELETKEVT